MGEDIGGIEYLRSTDTKWDMIGNRMDNRKGWLDTYVDLYHLKLEQDPLDTITVNIKLALIQIL